jgi:cysteine desulfurase/selenocysteine lyase
MMPAKADNMPWFATIKDEFPIFAETMNGKPLAFLDSASSAQKPTAVIKAMTNAMENHYANIHRGLYAFSQQMTAEYEAVRGKAQAFLNAATEKEIIFTRNSTEGINLVAQSWGGTNLTQGDEILLTEMEHHANIVPWQILQSRIGFTIKTIPVDAQTGKLMLEQLEGLLSPKTKLVSFVHASNVLGTVNPAKEIIERVKAYNSDIVTLLDASQSVVHGGVDVQAMECDFLVFTAHKLYGPTGAGVLYGRSEVLANMPPYQGGGDMIKSVGFGSCETQFQDAPHKFEAGTPSFIDVIGLGAAIDYVESIGAVNIKAREIDIFETLYSAISTYDGINITGAAGFTDLQKRVPVISFTADWAHASDINMILDQCGVAVRTGQHCAEPLMKVLGVEATMRVSLGLYNDEGDIEQFIKALDKAKMMLG